MDMTGSRSTPFGGLNGSDPDQWIGGGRGRDGQRSLVFGAYAFTRQCSARFDGAVVIWCKSR